MFAKTTSSQPGGNAARSGLQRRVIWAAQLSLAAAIIYFLTRAALAYFAPESLWEAPAATPATVVRTQSSPTAKLNTGFDPFHRNTQPQDVVIEIGTDAPETTLNLKLYGRRAGKDGSAILEGSDKTQKVFRIGDEIMNGVTLKAVHTDYIVLSQGGRIERLTFERDDESLLSPPGEDASAVSSSPPQSLVKTIPQNMSVESLMAGVNLAPSVQNGSLTGFRITPKNGSINLASLGLKSGDIVSAIGDIDLTSPTLNPAQLPEQLSGYSQVKLTVLRGSETVYVTLGN